MRTNHTIEQLEERVKYYKKAVKNFPHLSKFTKRDLENAKLDLEEGLERKYVGVDDEGAKAYLNNEVLYVEGKPSGWQWSGESLCGERKVCYDGGTKWFGNIKFYGYINVV